MSSELRIGLVGVGRDGPSSYHARSFSSILNGFDQARTPADWPVHTIPVEGARIATVWDDDVDAAAELANVFSIPRVAKSMEDVATDVDGVIVVDDLTMTHQRRARFFVENGLATFVDKPLSSSPREAEELLGLAERVGTLIMSTSALRYARETTEAREQIEAAGRLRLATAVCQGQYMGDDAVIHYGIHPLELAYSVLGSGAESVQNVGDGADHVIKIRYRDGRILVLMVFADIAQTFRLALYGEHEAVTVVVEDWDFFYASMLKTFVKMIREQTLPIPLPETLEIIRVLAAAKRSRASGGAEISIDPNTT